MSLDVDDVHPDGLEAQQLRQGFLLQRFSAFAELSAPERILVAGLAQTLCYHPPSRNLYAAGTISPPLRVVVSGWGCRYRLLSGGRRQIISLRLPGDLIGHMLPPGMPSICAVLALTGMETVDAQPIAELLSSNDPEWAGLLHALHFMNHLDDVFLCDQIVRLGRQSASERFAHLLARFHERLSRVGLADGDRFCMPLTQDVLADVLGLSVVHMNRTVQQLRQAGLLDLQSGYATLPDLARLQAFAGWSPLPIGQHQNIA